VKIALIILALSASACEARSDTWYQYAIETRYSSYTIKATDCDYQPGYERVVCYGGNREVIHERGFGVISITREDLPR